MIGFEPWEPDVNLMAQQDELRMYVVKDLTERLRLDSEFDYEVRTQAGDMLSLLYDTSFISKTGKSYSAITMYAALIKLYGAYTDPQNFENELRFKDVATELVAIRSVARTEAERFGRMVYTQEFAFQTDLWTTRMYLGRYALMDGSALDGVAVGQLFERTKEYLDSPEGAKFRFDGDILSSEE